MTVWVTSNGIYKRRSMIEKCLAYPVKKIARNSVYSADDIIVGWGLKSNTDRAKYLAEAQGIKYFHLEDGFISYLGHPARGGISVSLIADDLGIYYDATGPSRLEKLVASPLTKEEESRARRIVQQIKDSCATKYNNYAKSRLPVALEEILGGGNQENVLIVDQIDGDLSIPGALADHDDFTRMLQQARLNHPNAQLILRAHPDSRYGKKRGVLQQQSFEGIDGIDEIVVINEPCHPHALVHAVDHVYTVSSQLGFEALLLGKTVHCFGMPFYAGWGLTIDTKCCRRRQPVSLLQLVSAALIRYPVYFDPILQREASIEDILDLISSQRHQGESYERLVFVGFSLWKRSFLRSYFRDYGKSFSFVSKLPKRLQPGETLVLWGSNYPELSDCIRVEDGFIRSLGLGSNLRRPSSIAVDHSSIYYNQHACSDLEKMLNSYQLDSRQRDRAEALIALLKKTGVSKYNIGKGDTPVLSASVRKPILVVGQVEGDQSIVMGSKKITSNEQLLWRVRELNPTEHIIYKPHPDVVAKNRAGHISKGCLEYCVDTLVQENSLDSLFGCVKELHTMTSLSGFEALIRGVPVVTWGQPFYAGWGLTHDMFPPEQRHRRIDLNYLVYISLIKYPSYYDWETGLKSSPERLIKQLEKLDQCPIKGANRLEKWVTKLSYLFESLNVRLN